MSACESSKPNYVYKLVPHDSPVPSVLPNSLPVSTVDDHSGFVHLSTARQLPGALAHFFTSDPRVYVLKLAYAPLEDAIRWETPEGAVCSARPGEGLFPHLYNGLKVGRKEVESVWVLERGRVGGWEEAMERDEGFKVWLV